MKTGLHFDKDENGNEVFTAYRMGNKIGIFRRKEADSNDHVVFVPDAGVEISAPDLESIIKIIQILEAINQGYLKRVKR